MQEDFPRFLMLAVHFLSSRLRKLAAAILCDKFSVARYILTGLPKNFEIFLPGHHHSNGRRKKLKWSRRLRMASKRGKTGPSVANLAATPAASAAAFKGTQEAESRPRELVPGKLTEKEW